MKKLCFIIGLAILIAVSGAVLWQRESISPKGEAVILETQVNGEGEVTVAVTPKNLAAGVFEIVLNTLIRLSWAMI